ncbi:MAG: c-type cytochrome, partial [Candidatus Korobacteraceae bacterium]
AKWKSVVANARNEGLYTPIALKDTISIPGARGGANWGSTSANPTDGTLYVASFDAPSIYRLSTEPPGGGMPPAASAAGGPGQNVYAQNCQACHGADRAGLGGAIPSLQGVVQRLGEAAVRETILSGRGQMPAFASLAESDLNALVSFLANPTGGPGRGGDQDFSLRTGQEQSTAPWQGPVAGRGGAPIPDEVKPNSPSGPNPYFGMAGPTYPAGVDAPETRYYTDYNIIRHITSPPWSTITAYDMNKGTIKWQIPIGEDVRAVKEGHRNTGTMLEPKGVIVTPNGLVIHAARDGKIRAYDADNGKELWSADLPAGSAAIPAMYQVNGRTYILVSATAPTPQLGVEETGVPNGRGAFTAPTNGAKAYIAFALPDKPKPAR